MQIDKPTISAFDNAGHTHANAAGGGQITDAALSAAVGVTKGGTGLATIADKTLLVTTALNTLSALTIGAGQSIRRNAGDTAFEAYTPSAGTGDALTSNPLSQFAATTSAQLAEVISDETGTGALVFANTPTLVTPVLGAATGTSVDLTTSATVGVASTTAGKVIFRNATNAFTQTFTGSNPAASIDYVLPTTAPTAGQVLSSTAPSAGVATLSWATAGGFSWGTSVSSGAGTGLAMTTADVAGDKPFITMAHTASGTLTANTTTQSSLSTSRTHTAATSVTDNFIGLNLTRTNVMNNAGGTLLSQGSILTITGSDTQTAGTLTPTYNLITLNPSLKSTGSAISLTAGGVNAVTPTNGFIYAVGNAAAPVGFTLFKADTVTSGNSIGFYAIARGSADIGVKIDSGGNVINAYGIYNTITARNIGGQRNTGIYASNNGTGIDVQSDASGASLHLYQSGSDGTAALVYGGDNVNASTNGLVNYTLSNTQSGATVMQKINTGSSAQAHKLYLATGSNASTSARAFTAEMATGWTGRLFSGSVNSVDKFIVDKDGVITGVGTNLTGTATGLTAGITNALKSATTTVDVSAATAPTSGQVLTATAGTTATWQTPSGGTPVRMSATSFETAARFDTSDSASSGTGTFGASGLDLQTSATSGGRAACAYKLNALGTSPSVFAGSPTFTTSVRFQNKGTNGDAYFGLGYIIPDAASINFATTKHAGFKITWTASGTASLYATQADGGTENASSALTTLVADDELDLIVKVNSTTSVDYYWRKNHGALSSATNLTSNMPDAGTSAGFAVTNRNNASATEFLVFSASYSR